MIEQKKASLRLTICVAHSKYSILVPGWNIDKLVITTLAMNVKGTEPIYPEIEMPTSYGRVLI